MDKNRRNILGLLATAPFAVFAARAGAAEPPKACFDPVTLPLSQKNRRRSLGYADPAVQPARRCGGCAFFTAAATGCGTCQLLSAGPVSATASCTSFAPKPAQ